MLLSVCLNPAVDVTYRVAAPLTAGLTHRVASVAERPGGKAINVARVLLTLGEPVRVLAPAGGRNGQVVRAGLVAAGFAGPAADLSVELAGETRRTVTIVDGDGTATVLNEPGPTVRAGELAALVARFEALLTEGGVSLAVLAGSLPPGVPVEVYATLTRIARQHGVRTVVDAEGEPLTRAVTAGVYLVKPNLAELETTLGRRLGTVGEIVDGGRELRARGAANVVISCGREGLVAVTGAGAWRASGPAVAGNPTGAGDALVAALARGTVAGSSWPDRLRDGVALSAASVLSPVAGEVDPAEAARLRPLVTMEEVPGVVGSQL